MSAALNLRRAAVRHRIKVRERRRRTRLVVREEAMYMAEIPDGGLAEHARLNPGTLIIEDMEGNQLWPAKLAAVPDAQPKVSKC